MGWMIPLGILVAVILVVIAIYNRLVALRQNRKQAFSDIDVQLKQRFNLVPQLVETVKGYASHEKEVFEKVTEARAGVANSQNETDRISAEKALGDALISLHAVAEDYPDLKADQTFQQLMGELSDIENKIAAARRFFNSATSEYNIAVEQFPASIIAKYFGFEKLGFFEIDDAEKEAVKNAPEVKF